jgi:DNA-binding NtrC family response regulator
MMAWRSMVNRLLKRSHRLSRKWKRFTAQSRTVLAVTQDDHCRMSLRVLSIEEGWRILFAQSIDDALRLCSGGGSCVLIYDNDAPGADWRGALCRLLASKQPMFPIVIRAARSARLRSDVVNCGGYDVAQKPLDLCHFTELVKGAFEMAESIDDLELDGSYSVAQDGNTHLPV